MPSIVLRASRILLLSALVGGLLLFTAWPFLPWAPAQSQRTIVIYGFSILGEALNEGVLPAFGRSWQKSHGESVDFITSFAGSGTITNQIRLGVPVEVAIFAHELDALRLSKLGVIRQDDWRELPHAGVINKSPFIILVRPGNPKGIHELAHLSHPDIKLVHPDPLISGGALWSILAEYYAPIALGGSHEDGLQQLSGIWKNVAIQAGSARAARTQFDQGFGDALITYEQEALRDRARGKLKAEVIYPRSTILSEHVLVPVYKNIAPNQRELIAALLQFLWGDEAQKIFQEYGFRSVDQTSSAEESSFEAIEHPFYIKDLGGWEVAERDIIEGVWKNQVLKH